MFTNAQQFPTGYAQNWRLYSPCKHWENEFIDHGTSYIEPAQSLLGFAYQRHRSSEILTGVIGGLTIILGMITAGWLRASREQIELTRSRFFELLTHLERYLYNFDEYMRDQYSDAPVSWTKSPSK